jgi:membrane-associated protease RseP (regulator of RpoE activity)
MTLSLCLSLWCTLIITHLLFVSLLTPHTPQVYCAGAWHNLILALFSLLVSKCLPTLFYPWYEAQPVSKSNHHRLFDNHHHHQQQHHSTDSIDTVSPTSPHYYHRHIKHDGLALELQPYSPFYNLLGKPDDSLVALDDSFISSHESLIDVISKIDARASFATPLSLFKLNTNSNLNHHHHHDTIQHNNQSSSSSSSSSPMPKQQEHKSEEVVQLQGLCMHSPNDFLNHDDFQNRNGNGGDNGGEECFIVGSVGVESRSGSAYNADSDNFVRVCRRTISMIESAKEFASQVHKEYENDAQPSSSSSPKSHELCKHCKRLPVFTCSRSLDCPRVKDAKSSPPSKEQGMQDEVRAGLGVGGGGVGLMYHGTVRGSCARAVLYEGESLVSVHLSSGKSLAWRGDVVLDSLHTALTPAAMKLRPYVSRMVHEMATLITPSSSSSSIDGSKPGDGIIFWLVRLPSRILAFFSMLAQVSISIALINILPIYYLDGHLASVQFIRLWLLSAPPPPPPPPITRKSHGSHHHHHSHHYQHHISINVVPSNISSGIGSSGGGGGGSLGNASNLTRTSSGNRPQSPLDAPNNSHSTSTSSSSTAYDLDNPELEQLYRDRYHDWNALHMRQTRYTWALLGSGTVLVLINLVLGGVALLGP